MWNYDEQWMINTVGPVFFKLYKDAGRIYGDDPVSIVWPSRVMVDIYQNNMSPDASFKKHANECAVQLGQPSPFSNPSRDSIINVKDNFCNIFDADGIPIFEPYIDGLILNNVAKANDWVARLRDAGSTHLTLDLSGDYPENLGWAPRYPWVGMDWSNNISGFADIIKWVQDKGFTPNINLSMDGIEYDPKGNGVGWKWGIANLAKVIETLGEFTEQVLWTTGYDGCFPNWTPEQTITMLKLMRSVVGPNGCICTEFWGNYMHMGKGPYDWADDRLGMLDCFFIEAMTFPPNTEALQQTAARLLGSAKKNIEPKNDYNGCYLTGTKKINICWYEDIAYQCIRKQATSADASFAVQTASHYGFTSFGNGQLI
jgi:hypothetical protein